MTIKVESYIKELRAMKLSLVDSMDTDNNVENLSRIAENLSPLIAGQIAYLENHPLPLHEHDLGKLSSLAREYSEGYPDQSVKGEFFEHISMLDCL